MTNLLKVLESDNKMRLDVVAARMFPNFSRTQLKKWIHQGRVVFHGEICMTKESG